MRFKHYMNEGYELFGYDKNNIEKRDLMARSPNFDHNEFEGDKPLKGFNTEYVVDILEKAKIDRKPSNRFFADQIQWGSGAGAVRLKFTTNYRAIIERKSHDLQGEPIWVTKRFYKVNLDEFRNQEPIVAEELLKEIKAINAEPLDTPMPKFKDFDRLVNAVAHRTRGVVNDPLYFEDIKKVNDEEYIICFGVRGQGVQAPDQRRVEETLIHMKYHNDKGTIQIIEGNVESPLAVRSWELVPSDYQLTFVPSQSRDEIVNTIATIMRYF